MVEGYPPGKIRFRLNCPVKRPILKIDPPFNGDAGIFPSKPGQLKIGYPNRQLYDKIYGNILPLIAPPIYSNLKKQYHNIT